MNIIQRTYPNYFPKDFDPEIFDVQATFWHRSLANYSWAETLMAFEAWLNTHDRPPQLNQFKEHLLNMVKPESLMSPEKAWDVVSEAVRRFGSYNQDKAFATFTTPVIKAVKNIGGWQKICQTEIGQPWDFLRKNFLEVFKDYVTEEDNQFLLPPDTLRRIQDLREIEEQKRLDEPEDEAK